MQTRLATTRTRLVLIATVALLAAQSLFIQRYGQPYPAILMPGFRGSGGYRDGRVQIDRYEAVFVADGEEFSFPPKVLLGEFPDSYHGAIARTSLTPRNKVLQVVPRPTRWTRLRDAIFPGYATRDTSRASQEAVKSLHDWLRDRARVLVPNRPASRVEIRWFREIARLDGGRLETVRKPTGALVVVLNGEPK